MTEYLNPDERKLWDALEQNPKGALKARSVLLLLSRIMELRKENEGLRGDIEKIWVANLQQEQSDR